MNDKMKKLQGERLKEIRNILGLSQKGFGLWLASKGVQGNYNEPYKEITVASWENGRRKVPEEVMKAISENLNINGHNVQISYLSGDSKYMTQSAEAILTATIKELINTKFEQMDIDDFLKETSSDPLNKMGNVLTDEILPLYGIDKNDIFDYPRFTSHIYQEMKRVIDTYIKTEREEK